MDYQEYSNWKGWLTNTEFGELSTVDEAKYRLQLDRAGVAYKRVNALEIGFGNGAFMSFLLKNSSTVEGVEIQQPLLAAAKAKGFQVHSSIEQASQGPYDLIAAFDVLEHLTIEQLQELFRHCRKMLKSNGTMLFRFPNADSFAGMPAQHGDFTHITPIGQTKLQQLVEPHGLKIERFEGEVVYPRRVIVDTVRSCFRSLLMRGMGIGTPYFFSCNVVAVVKIKA